MIHLAPGFKVLLLRLFLFLLLFLLITGIIGPWVVTSKLLYGFHFFIYGNIGKMVILGSIIFILLTRKKLFSLPACVYTRWNIVFVFLSLILINVFFTNAQLLLTFGSPEKNPLLTIGTHLLLIFIPFLALIGTLGIPLLRQLLHLFKKELLICIALGTVLYVAIFQVWKLWPYFSAVVLKSVTFLFSLTFENVRVIPPFILQVESFAVRIEQACSGLDSLFMFSILYWVIGIIDWKVFNKRKLFLMFIPAAIGLFLVNIVRVYLIILVGVLYSPELALQLFHTYAGMIFFIIYFGIFMKLFYGWMKK